MENAFQLIVYVEMVTDDFYEIYCLFNGTHQDVTGHREVVHSYDIPYPYIVQDPYLRSRNSQQRMSRVILRYVGYSSGVSPMPF